MAILGDYFIFMFVGQVITGYTQACTSQEKYIVTFKASLLSAKAKSVYTDLSCSESIMTLLKVKFLQLHLANLHINASRIMDHDE